MKKLKIKTEMLRRNGPVIKPWSQSWGRKGVYGDYWLLVQSHVTHLIYQEDGSVCTSVVVDALLPVLRRQPVHRPQRIHLSSIKRSETHNVASINHTTMYRLATVSCTGYTWYNVDVFQRSHTGIKNAVLSSFTSLVHNVLGLYRSLCLSCFLNFRLVFLNRFFRL